MQVKFTVCKGVIPFYPCSSHIHHYRFVSLSQVIQGLTDIAEIYIYIFPKYWTFANKYLGYNQTHLLLYKPTKHRSPEKKHLERPS